MRENKLSTRGLTSELADRLIRFEIYQCIPEANVFWNDAEDVASDLESEPEHPERLASEEIEENAQALQTKYNEELGVQKTVAPSADAARGAFHGHRLFLSKEIRMLHKQLSDGNTMEVHHIAQTADVLYNNLEQYAKPAP